MENAWFQRLKLIYDNRFQLCFQFQLAPLQPGLLTEAGGGGQRPDGGGSGDHR
jgi:hypothetical protein